MKLKIKKIGHATGLILSKESAAVAGRDAPEGLGVSRDDKDFEEVMGITRRVMIEYAETLRALARFEQADRASQAGETNI